MPETFSEHIILKGCKLLLYCVLVAEVIWASGADFQDRHSAEIHGDDHYLVAFA